jgi:hypothetical protein
MTGEERIGKYRFRITAPGDHRTTLVQKANRRQIGQHAQTVRVQQVRCRQQVGIEMKLPSLTGDDHGSRVLVHFKTTMDTRGQDNTFCPILLNSLPVTGRRFLVVSSHSKCNNVVHHIVPTDAYCMRRRIVWLLQNQ